MNIDLEWVKKLPFHSFTDRGNLPHSCGVYFVVFDNRVLYVGQSFDIRQRFWGHEVIGRLAQRHPDLHIYYFVPPIFQESALGSDIMLARRRSLISLETLAIKSLTPDFNTGRRGGPRKGWKRSPRSTGQI